MKRDFSLQEAVDASARRGQLLAGFDPSADCASAVKVLKALIDAGLDDLAQPAAGATLQRWRALSEVASHDLSVAKLFESHTDALAILDELGDAGGASPGSSWGVWAAEPPDAKVLIAPGAGDRVALTGKKSWCSGAGHLTHALITVWGKDGTGPMLAKLNLRQAGICVSPQGWSAVGMAATGSVDVYFSDAVATLVGGAGAYLSRPGFWHGGAGIAACWYGGATRLAQALRLAAGTAAGAGGNAFRHAALGKADGVLQQCAAVLRAAAGEIDLHPRDDSRVLATRVRLAAEACALEVLNLVGRSLGAVPFCKDGTFARIAADLPVFVRQSGGERDACAVGEAIAGSAGSCWDL